MFRAHLYSILKAAFWLSFCAIFIVLISRQLSEGLQKLRECDAILNAYDQQKLKSESAPPSEEVKRCRRLINSMHIHIELSRQRLRERNGY